MAFFSSLFKSSSTEVILNSPFEMSIQKEIFCEIKTILLFKKILYRCYSRSEGAEDENKIASLFDSSEKSGANRGLISILAKAMTKKLQIAIIYEVGVVRLASYKEKEQIKKDYKDGAKSSLGILVDFTNYDLSDIIKCYMSMIYDIMESMNTQVGLAKALQIKINNLRGTVSAVGKEEPIAQAKSINESLKSGNSVLLDKNDQVEVMDLNSSTVKDSMNLVYGQLASDIGVPLSFVNGELSSGMSATGEADTNAMEDGIQDFFNSIFKPVCDKLYDWNLRFISDDWRYFTSMIDSLIIVENSGLLSDKQKQAFADRLMPVDK